MKLLMYKVNQEKWNTFSVQEQIKNIAVELSRATQAALHTEKSDEEWINGAYERALILIDASLVDPKWQNKKKLYELRDAVAALYSDTIDPAISRFISSQLYNL